MTKESLLRGLDIPLSDASLVDLYRFMAWNKPKIRMKATQPGAKNVSRSFVGASADRKAAAGSERQDVSDDLSRYTLRTSCTGAFLLGAPGSRPA
jgi:hypothetical protein